MLVSRKKLHLDFCWCVIVICKSQQLWTISISPFQYLQRIQYSHTKFARKNDYTIVLKKERKKRAPFVASLLFKHDDEYGAIFSAVNKKSLHYIDVVCSRGGFSLLQGHPRQSVIKKPNIWVSFDEFQKWLLLSVWIQCYSIWYKNISFCSNNLLWPLK